MAECDDVHTPAVAVEAFAPAAAIAAVGSIRSVAPLEIPLRRCARLGAVGVGALWSRARLIAHRRAAIVPVRVIARVVAARFGRALAGGLGRGARIGRAAVAVRILVGIVHGGAIGVAGTPGPSAAGAATARAVASTWSPRTRSRRWRSPASAS